MPRPHALAPACTPHAHARARRAPPWAHARARRATRTRTRRAARSRPPSPTRSSRRSRGRSPWTLQALRDRLKESQGQLECASAQLSDAERAREQLTKQAGAASSSAEEHRQLLSDLRHAQTSANSAESRALDFERRLEVASQKQSELQGQLSGKLQELKAAQSLAAQADEAGDLRARLQTTLDQMARVKVSLQPSRPLNPLPI